MDPIARLVAEHEMILKVADWAQREAETLREGGPLRVAKVGRVLEFIRTFADAYHHGKEEELLFARMAERGFSRQAGPLAVMLREHQQGRDFVRQAVSGLAAAEEGSVTALGAVAAGLAGWAELIRGHIEKENQVLYPMAQNVLSETDWRQLGEEFDRFEAGHPEGPVVASGAFVFELATK